MRERAKTTTVTIRGSHADRDLIDRAAAIKGQSLTAFVMDAACRQAQDVLCDQTNIRLDRKTFAAFVAELDRPPCANPRLRATMQGKAPWETI
jgi:uncharacterized protein (DUF1778 family)